MAKKDAETTRRPSPKNQRKAVPHMGATKKGMHTQKKGKFERLKMAEKAVEKLKEEVELIGDKTSKAKLKKALSDWHDIYVRSSPRLSAKAMMGGGKIKKNYSKGGGVRPTSY